MQQRKEQATREPIDETKTYPIASFMQVSGLGKQAMANARRKGLPVIRISGRAFVRGRDFSEWLGRLSGDVE